MGTVQLNHIYTVVDKETYENIKQSDLINSLAFAYEQKNFADNQIPWEGFYIRGKNTYLEFFYPQERYPRIGISGIGMGIDTKGGLDAVLQELRKDHPNAKKGYFSRHGKPWFAYVAVNDSFFFEQHSYWIMEYASEHFSENSDDVSRAHYNEDKYDPKKFLSDIESFSIGLKTEGKCILSSYLKGSGLDVDDFNYTTLENVVIRLSEETASHKGIFEIEFSLIRPFEDGSFRIGNSALTLQGKKGTWTFFGNVDESENGHL